MYLKSQSTSDQKRWIVSEVCYYSSLDLFGLRFFTMNDVSVFDLNVNYWHPSIYSTAKWSVVSIGACCKKSVLWQFMTKRVCSTATVSWKVKFWMRRKLTYSFVVIAICETISIYDVVVKLYPKWTADSPRVSKPTKNSPSEPKRHTNFKHE